MPGGLVRRLPRASRVRARRRGPTRLRRPRIGRQSLPAVRQRRAGIVGAAALRRHALALRDGRSRAEAACRPQRDRRARVELGRCARPVAQHSKRTGFLLQGDGRARGRARQQRARLEAARRQRVSLRAVRLRRDPRLLRRLARRSGRRRALSVGLGAAPTIDDATWFTVPAPAPRAASAPPGPLPAGASSAVVGRVLLQGAPSGGEVAGWLLVPRNIPPMEETVQRFARVRRAEGVTASDAIRARRRSRSSFRRTPRRACCSTSRAPRTPIPCSRRAAGREARSRSPTPKRWSTRSGRKGNRNDVDGTHASAACATDPPRRRRASPLPDAVLALVPLRAARRRDRRRAADASHDCTASSPRIRSSSAAASRAIGVDRQRLGDGLEWRSARCVRDVHGHAVLRAAPVRRRHAHPGAHLALRRRATTGSCVRRSSTSTMSRIAEGITTSRYPVGAHPAHPALLADSRRDGARLPHASRRPRVRATEAGGSSQHPRLVRSSRGLDRNARPDAVLELRRLVARAVRAACRAGANDGHSATISLLYAYALQHAADAGERCRSTGPGRAVSCACGLGHPRRAARERGTATRGLFRDAPGHGARSVSTRTCSPFSPTRCRRPIGAP